ncbi:MAG: M20 family metallo-hydrolase [Myxococcales bacterium]|nr:M20 family metallo-hydrolase [Myxococcales bacterium]
MKSAIAIDADRLWTTLHTLAEVGAYTDERTGLRGVNRLALTDADAAGRRTVMGWFEAAGLAVRVDRIGNVYGRRAGRDADAAPVMAGSHIDSVPTGGAFDGALGVIGALEAVRALNDAGHVTRRPIEIGFFTDEEGCRFGTDMLGSAVACGRIPLEQALALTDKDGLRVGDELARIGFAGSAEHRIAAPHAFVEVHVEQGPTLAAAGVDLGVVEGVQGIAWWAITLSGRSAHAGTTPMALRRDPGVVAARLHVLVDALARSGRFGAQMRATVGRVAPHPGLVNIVPSQVELTLDLRNPDDDQMARAEDAIFAELDAMAAAAGVTVERRRTARTPRVPFDIGVQQVIAEAMEARGCTYQRLLSGAGHDAQEFSALCPTAMVFVPGLYEGISHNPREYSTPEACAAGVQVLTDALVRLADG